MLYVITLRILRLLEIRVNTADIVQNIIEQKSARYDTTHYFRPSISINSKYFE